MYISNYSDFRDKAGELLGAFNIFIQKHSLAGKVRADHMCYKCSSREEFESIRALLELESRFIYQSFISKRRIAFIAFKEPFETSAGPIAFLELSDQKPDCSQKSAFDHIEIVPLEMTVPELAETLTTSGEKVIKVERPHHTTYDIDVLGGFSLKLSTEFLVEKIKREEMGK